jgi:hypothetical protein
VVYVWLQDRLLYAIEAGDCREEGAKGDGLAVEYKTSGSIGGSDSVVLCSGVVRCCSAVLLLLLLSD